MAASSGGLARLCHVLGVCLRLGVSWGRYRLARHRAVCWLLGGRRQGEAGRRLEDPLSPLRLQALFEELGGTFIKFGQMLALQPDILSVEHCDALFKLLDRVEPFSYAEVERIFAEEHGVVPEAIFDSIDHQPLATASIGQVHVATLNGRKVAVKVRRPSVETDFAGDVRLMKVAVRLIHTLRLSLFHWLLEPLTEFMLWTEDELDFRLEARNLERLRANAASNPTQTIPEIFTAYTSRRTLVIEFLDGVTLLDYLRARERGDEVLLKRLEKQGFDAKRFASNIIANFLGDAFLHGIYHADLHPANLMIMAGSVVGYLDFGITGVMSPYSRRHLSVMTLALAEGDLETLNTQFLKLSVFTPESDPDSFYSGLAALTQEWYGGRTGRQRLEISFTRVMTDMLQLSRQTGVMPERDIIKYIRSAIAIDGLIVRFEPDFHVGAHLEKTASRFLAWQGLTEAIGIDNLTAQSASSARLLLDGTRRSAAVLDQLALGELPVVIRQEPAARRPTLPALPLVPLAATVLVLTYLLSTSGPPPALGFNLFTAEAALVSGGFIVLLAALARSSWRHSSKETVDA